LFFGEGILRVLVTDPNADDDSTVEDITVNIDAEPDSGSQGSTSVIVPETSDSSGRFEFYMVHQAATAVEPADLDPINSAGVEGDGTCVSDCAPFVTFGPSGDLEVEADLYEEVDFEITADDTSISVKYEEALAQVEVDRTAYGSDSFVYIFIIDQDANLNPTDADEFTVDPGSTPNSDLLELGGGAIVEAVTFRETGDNTASFEGRYELGASMTFDSESVVLTLFDKANYNATLAADENGSGSTDEASFTIGNTDGTIDIGNGSPTTWDAVIMSSRSSYSLGDNVTLTIEDPDANASTTVADKVDITLTNSDGASAVSSAAESGPNTGLFEASFSIGADGRIGGTQLEVEPGGTLAITYVDKKPADYAAKVQTGQNPEKELTLELGIAQTGTGMAALNNPVVRNMAGPAGQLLVGSQLGLGVMVENNSDAPQPFVVLVDIRDADGLSVYIAWQGGTLDPAGKASVEVSWIPELAGDYEVRTFAVSSLDDGTVISEVASSAATIGA
jgi:hypothetical protein